MKQHNIAINIILIILCFLSTLAILPAEEPDNHGIKRVMLWKGGWRTTLRTDGSAYVQYGSIPIDGARTDSDVFDIEKVGNDIRKIIESAGGDVTPETKVAVGVSNRIREMIVLKDVENSKAIQDICRKAFENLKGIDEGTRFRELLKQYPPFGMTDLEIREDQTGLRPEMSLTEYREMIYPDELTGDEDLSKFIIDRKSEAYVASLRRDRPAKRPETPETHAGGRSQTAWWTSLAVLSAAVIAVLLWLARKRASA